MTPVSYSTWRRRGSGTFFLQTIDYECKPSRKEHYAHDHPDGPNGSEVVPYPQRIQARQERRPLNEPYDTDPYQQRNQPRDNYRPIHSHQPHQTIGPDCFLTFVLPGGPIEEAASSWKSRRGLFERSHEYARIGTQLTCRLRSAPEPKRGKGEYS